MLQKIQEQLKVSMKEKDELRTSVLRMLLSEFKYAQIEKRAPLDESESTQVVLKAIKKRKEAIEMYRNGGRQELADKEAAEQKILETFVPAAMEEPEAREKITAVIAELGVQDKKEMGRVMKEVLNRYRGKIDGKLVQKIVSETLK